MTGTGTQEDPYIVDTWSDFVTAVGEPSAYVEIAENTVWDMNEILPNGLTSAVTAECRRIEGNFAEIRNIVKKSSYILSGKSSVEINRLNLLNITETASGDWFYQNTSGTSMNFHNCAITGILSKGHFADTNFSANGASIRFTNDEQLGCNLNLVFSGSSALSSRPTTVYYENSLITLGGKSTAAGSSIQFPHFENCYIQGECPWSKFYIYSASANIIDMEIDLLDCGSSASYKQNVVNAGKVISHTNAVQYLTLVTGAQLSDAGYLKSVGFPIL